MSFKEFDDSKLTNEKEKYAKEIKEKYGNTEAYKEYDEKKKKYSKDDFNTINDKLFDLVKDFSLLINEDPKSEKVQSLVKVWQDFITKYYYNCTKEILYGLGQMYIADERFTKNMDKYAKGTAKLISDAIKYYCKGE